TAPPYGTREAAIAGTPARPPDAWGASRWLTFTATNRSSAIGLVAAHSAENPGSGYQECPGAQLHHRPSHIVGKGQEQDVRARLKPEGLYRPAEDPPTWPGLPGTPGCSSRPAPAKRVGLLASRKRFSRWSPGGEIASASWKSFRHYRN